MRRYRSTLDAMDALYDRVSRGGIIVHNNWQYTSARAAMLHFRKQRNIEYMPLHLVRLFFSDFFSHMSFSRRLTATRWLL